MKLLANAAPIAIPPPTVPPPTASDTLATVASIVDILAAFTFTSPALITWLSYAVYLHARNQKSWAGRPAALLLVVAFGMVLVTYSGSLWFSGLHAYSGL